ncbi:MAG: family phosphohydrolase, partial [Paenibacillaceae bacterium]|nr:family phosphohydrolase [Paenibacillaceae bacterium]
PSYPSVQISYDASLAGLNLLFSQALDEGRIEPDIVDASFEPLAESFHKEKNLVSLMLSLENTTDYTFNHSVQVGMLAYYLARWLGYPENFALDAGKAGFIHDIGMSRVDSSILKKPSKLTDEEYSAVKKHVEYGFQILRGSYPDNSPIMLGALQHHERMDGSGYPHGLKGEDISVIGRILAVADIYSAMITSRVYQKERDLLFVLKEIHRLSFTSLDPTITQVFIRNLVPNLLGKTVELFDGRRGTIVLTNYTDFFRPLIRVDNEFLDLAKHPELSILKILA